MIFFTSVNLNYLPKARLLASSIKLNMPESTFVLALLDDENQLLSGLDTNFDEIIGPSQLGIADFHSWIFGHDVVEACTAQKGRVLKILLERYPNENVIYLDPDIEVFSRFVELENELLHSHVILTPHITIPENTKQAIEDNELSALIHGTYNLGFLAVRNSDQGREFAEWWDERLQHYCFDDKERGLFTDQKWVDLAPGLFEGVSILRHPGYNIATWNILQRNIEYNVKLDNYEVNGEQVRFIHFSGFDSGAHHQVVEAHTTKNSIFRFFSNQYTLRLKHFEETTPKFPQWIFSKLEDGTEIQPQWRKEYRENLRLRRISHNPFKLSKSDFSNEVHQRVTNHYQVPLSRFVSEKKLWTEDILIDGAYRNTSIASTPNRRENPMLLAFNKFEHSDDLLFYPEVSAIEEFESRMDLSLPTVALFSHGLGGGVDQHLMQLGAFGLNKANILYIYPADATKRVTKLVLMNAADNIPLLIIDASADRITALLERLNVSTLHIHQAMGQENLVENLMHQRNFKIFVTLHDYYFLTTNWMFHSDVYGILNFPKSLSDLDDVNNEVDVEIRATWGSSRAWIELLDFADLLIYPSNSARVGFSNFIENKRNIVAYHPEFPHPELFESKINNKKQTRVAILGDLGVHKGANLIREIINSSTPEITFVGFGFADQDLINLFDEWKGSYISNDIVELMNANQITTILLPMQIHETYSYTLSEALRSGLSIVASDIPVFRERASHRNNVALIPPNAEPDRWIDAITHPTNSRVDNRDLDFTSRNFYKDDYWKLILDNNSKY